MILTNSQDESDHHRYPTHARASESFLLSGCVTDIRVSVKVKDDNYTHEVKKVDPPQGIAGLAWASPLRYRCKSLIMHQ